MRVPARACRDLEGLIGSFLKEARADGGKWIKEQEPIGWEALGVCCGPDGKPLPADQQPGAPDAEARK